MRKNRTVELLVIAVLGLSIIPIAIHPAKAAAAAPGFAVTNFATGFLTRADSLCSFGSFGCGPIGIAVDSSGNLYVGDIRDGYIYKFGPAGGVASTGTQLATPSSLGGRTPFGLTFGKGGNLYVALQGTAGNEIAQLDTTSGTIIRAIAPGTAATGIAADPLSGDLFVSLPGTTQPILRISGFASGPGTVTAYASVPCADGLAFGPDGTLYAAQCGVGVLKIAGTSSATPGATSFIANVPYIDGMAISANPSKLVIFGNRNDGIITEINFTSTTPTFTNIVTSGTRGDFATVGSDGCLYATQSDGIIKVTNADGSCIPPPLGPLFPPGPTASIRVSKFFTDSSLGPLPADSSGSPKVDVVLAGGTVTSTNPGQVLAWVNVTNTSGSPLQSLKLNETLPVDWLISPAWLPSKGAIHVFYANTTNLATNPDITQPSTVSISTSNPETVHVSVSNFTDTAIGHPLLANQSILLSVKLSYVLKGTSQSSSSYPRNYTDAATAVAWTKPSFTGNQFTGTGSAFFVADAKVVS